MGSLILCNKTKAEKPYYIEEFHLHIYSIEELCFYLCNNIYVLNNSLLNEKLCSWIENELDMPSLAKELHKYVKSNSLTLFVTTVLRSTGFCDASELDDIQHTLLSFKDQSLEEQLKKKADNLLGTGKYESAIREYENILKLSNNYKLGARFYSKVYHNLGVAYARRYLFDEAKMYYMKAYDLDKNDESIKQYLFACHMSMNDDEVQKIILDEPSLKSIYERVLNEYSGKERQYRFYQEQRRRDGKSFKDRIEACKEEYRRSLY